MNTKNPFSKIAETTRQSDRKSHDRAMRAERVAIRAYRGMNPLIYNRLQQLGCAIAGESAARFSILKFVRNFIWPTVSTTRPFVIRRSARLKKWCLQFPSADKYPKQNSTFIDILIRLDASKNPSGLAIYRGTDNKLFEADFDDKSLSTILLCHFSQRSAGANHETDTLHLKRLLRSGQITEGEFRHETWAMQANNAAPRVYAPPRVAPRLALKRVVRLRQIFCALCILGILLVLWTAKKNSHGVELSLKPETKLELK